jgi:hypothetical protein
MNNLRDAKRPWSAQVQRGTSGSCAFAPLKTTPPSARPEGWHKDQMTLIGVNMEGCLNLFHPCGELRVRAPWHLNRPLSGSEIKLFLFPLVSRPGATLANPYRGISSFPVADGICVRIKNRVRMKRKRTPPISACEITLLSPHWVLRLDLFYGAC